MVCEEKVRLVEEYAAASSDYSLIVSKWRADKEAGFGLKEGLISVTAARVKCVQTRRTLRDHKDEHRC
jgi:hypothetical protein